MKKTRETTEEIVKCTDIFFLFIIHGVLICSYVWQQLLSVTFLEIIEL